MVEDSPEFYPDEYFVGFDGSKLAGDGRVALAHRNADGTVQVITVDGFPGPDGEELYASHGYRLCGWDALTLRIWSQGQAMAAALDKTVEWWADWVAALPYGGPFDPVGWWATPAAAWFQVMQRWPLPPDPFVQQFPRIWGCDAGRRGVWIPPLMPLIPGLDCSLGPNAALEDHSRWTLPDYDEDPPPYPPLTDAQSRWVTDVGPMSNDTFRKILAESVVDYEPPRQQAEPTHLEIAPYRPMNAGEALEAGQGPDGTLID